MKVVESKLRCYVFLGVVLAFFIAAVLRNCDQEPTTTLPIGPSLWRRRPLRRVSVGGSTEASSMAPFSELVIEEESGGDGGPIEPSMPPPFPQPLSGESGGNEGPVPELPIPSFSQPLSGEAGGGNASFVAGGGEGIQTEAGGNGGTVMELPIPSFSQPLLGEGGGGGNASFVGGGGEGMQTASVPERVEVVSVASVLGQADLGTNMTILSGNFTRDAAAQNETGVSPPADPFFVPPSAPEAANILSSLKKELQKLVASGRFGKPRTGGPNSPGTGNVTSTRTDTTEGGGGGGEGGPTTNGTEGPPNTNETEGPPSNGTEEANAGAEPPSVGMPLEHGIFVRLGNDTGVPFTRGCVCDFTMETTVLTTVIAFNRELMVVLAGPELLVGSIEVVMANRQWKVSFRAWTSGVYSVNIRSDCAEGSLFAAFSLEVLEPDRPSSSIDERGPPSLCDEKVFGRWIREYNGMYLWKVSEECALQRLGPENWVEMVNARGIHEINFVGDSHLRVIYQHIRTLVEGHFDAENIKYHGDLRHALVGPNGASLQMNFYWVDGIYQNREFGCENRGMFSGRMTDFPSNVSRTAEVMIANSGAWTFAYCEFGREAYERHFPRYIEWLVSVGGPNVKRVWRTEAPYNGHSEGCRRRNNNGMAFANKMARDVAKKYDMQFYDAWHIEAPRYLENCGGWDPHYSCPYTHLGRARMWGAVGEAVTLDFMHFIVYVLN